MPEKWDERNLLNRDAERYSFQLLDPECELGTAKDLILRGTPDEMMNAQQIIIKSECEGFYELEDIILDSKRIDKLSINEHLASVIMKMQLGYVCDPFVVHRWAAHPWMWQDNGLAGVVIGPASRLTQVNMRYTGMIPRGYKRGHKFKATVLFMGPKVG